MAKFKGKRGNDRLLGTQHNDSFNVAQGGVDKVYGRGGNDSFSFGAGFTAKDLINGGGGNDVLNLKGNYAAGVTFKAKTMVNVEKIAVAAGHDYKLTTHDKTVAVGQTLTVDASQLGSTNKLTFDGSHETNGRFQVIGGAGDDAITGGAQSDTFDLTHGGNDTANGGGGDDSFSLGAAFTAADQIDGGDGSGDVVTLNGDYATVSTKVVFGATTLLNVEKIVLTAGHSYDLTSADQTVASGQTLTIDASGLGSSDFVRFDASAETDGKFIFKGGAGDDKITITSAAVLAASSIDGGGDSGTSDIFRDTVILNGDFSAGVTLTADNLANVETLRFGAGHNYKLIAADGLVPDDILLDVRGDLGTGSTGLGVGDSLYFDGSAETHGSFYLHGGQGNDTLIGSSVKGNLFDLSLGGTDIATGGSANDIFFAGAAGWDASDQLNGGAGFDYVYSETSANVNITFGANSLIGIEELQVSQHFGTGSFTFVMNDANVAFGQTMIIDGHSLGDTNPLSVNASAETNGKYTISAGAANDTLIGGAGADTLTGGGGADMLTGGGGADSFVFASAAQSTSTTYDTITDLNADVDKIDLPGTVTGFDGLANGSVSTASFDADLAVAVNSVLNSGHAVRLQVDAGSLSGQNFLVIDANGNGDYDAGLDYVINITGFTGTIATGLFV